MYQAAGRHCTVQVATRGVTAFMITEAMLAMSVLVLRSGLTVMIIAYDKSRSHRLGLWLGLWLRLWLGLGL